MMEKYTDIWNKFQKCKDYILKKNLVSQTDENWNFYIGKQWEGAETGGERLPVLNFIKPVIKYKTSVISQNSMVAKYSSLDNSGKTEIFEALNNYFAQSWEKGKMNSTVWDLIEAAAVQGDSYVYWCDGDTKKPPMILSNTAVLLGDENITDIQKQPFIIILERLDTESIKRVARENKISEEDIALIAPDNDAKDQIGNKEEVSGKVLSCLYLTKKDGVVNVARSTKAVEYEKLHPLISSKSDEPYGVGLRSYPIVNYIWEKTPNNARGLSEVRQLIPNQIELNRTLARRSMTVKLTAYPRIAYDETMLTNPEDLDKVGAPIGVNGGGAQSINQIVGYLNATSMSSDAESLANDLLNITKDLAGAGDFATGNINPEQASGAAILAVRDQAQVPLNKQVATYQQFVEDVALVFFDLWVAYNPQGIQSETIDEEGNPIETTIPIEDIEKLKVSVRVDVSQDSSWSKMAEQQWADNLFASGQISFEEYIELSPDNGTVPKGKAKEIIERRKALQQTIQQQQIMPQQEQIEQE